MASFLGNTFASTINNNVITGPGGSVNGVVTSGSYSTFTGNTFLGFGVGTVLNTGSTQNTVGLNTYFSNVTTKVVNNGTNNNVGTFAGGNMTGVVP